MQKLYLNLIDQKQRIFKIGKIFKFSRNEIWRYICSSPPQRFKWFISCGKMKQKCTEVNEPADCHHDNITVKFSILSHSYCAEEMLYGDVLIIFPMRTLLVHHHQIFWPEIIIAYSKIVSSLFCSIYYFLTLTNFCNKRKAWQHIYNSAIRQSLKLQIYRIYTLT